MMSGGSGDGDVVEVDVVVVVVVFAAVAVAGTLCRSRGNNTKPSGQPLPSAVCGTCSVYVCLAIID